MKYLVAALAFATTTCFAQGSVVTRNITVGCADIKKVTEMLDDFQELPMLRGIMQRDQKDQSLFLFFVNPKTKSWTILEKIDEKLYCVIAAGGELEPFPAEVFEEMRKRQERKRM
jgi:hypothetical protein